MLNKHQKSLLNQILLEFPNVHSVDFGYKEKNGKRTEEQSLRFRVEKKGFWPALFNKRIPKTYYGYITDVIEASEPQPRMAENFPPQNQYIEDPSAQQHRVFNGYIQAGISISGEKYSGSLGPIVYDATNRRWAALTASHLFTHGSNSESVSHPAIIEATSRRVVIGGMVTSIKDFYVDSALIHLSQNAARRRKFYPRGYNSNIDLRKFGSVNLGDIVFKAGRTTGNQSGIVTGYGLMGGRIDGHFFVQEAFYVDDLDEEYSNQFSGNGDSGCVVFNGRSEVVGVNTSTIIKGGRQQAGINPIDTIQFAYAQIGIDIQPNDPFLVKKEFDRMNNQSQYTTGYTTGYNNPFSNNK